MSMITSGSACKRADSRTGLGWEAISDTTVYVSTRTGMNTSAIISGSAGRSICEGRKAAAGPLWLQAWLWTRVWPLITVRTLSTATVRELIRTHLQLGLWIQGTNVSESVQMNMGVGARAGGFAGASTVRDLLVRAESDVDTGVDAGVAIFSRPLCRSILCHLNSLIVFLYSHLFAWLELVLYNGVSIAALRHSMYIPSVIDAT